MEEKTVIIDNLEIHYKTAGSGPAILILHGWGASSSSWVRFLNSAITQEYKIIVPDLPGFGESTMPLQPWELNDYVDWVNSFCKKENLSQVLLLGHSFGGRVAIKFAAKYPERLQGLILSDAAGISREKIFRIGFLLLSKFGKLLTALPILNRFQGYFRKFLYFFLGQRDYFLAEGTMKETFKKIITEKLTAYLEEIKVSTLVVWGEEDGVTPLKDAFLINRKIKNSKLVVLSGVGHSPNLEVPQKLSEVILNFLQGHIESGMY